MRSRGGGTRSECSAVIDHPLSKGVVCSVPVLAPDVRQYCLALAEVGWLRGVVCGLAYHEQSTIAATLRLVDRVFGTSWYARSEARRIGSEIPLSTFHPNPLTDLTPRTATRIGLRCPGPLTADQVPAAVDRRTARFIAPTDRLVLGREDGCLRSFRTARQVGAVTLYDLPIAYHTVRYQVLAEEIARFPNAAAVEPLSADEVHPTRIARKTAELTAADHVLVASQFVVSGLLEAGIPPDRITAVPYGCDSNRPYRSYSGRKPSILYVGHLSLRKGTPRLLAVWKKIGASRTHTLRLIGKSYLRSSFLAEYGGLFEHLPHIPRSELWGHYSTAQAFVFPSACDGFGLVLNEALSCGTPVIASSNTGAPGFITEGVQGFTYRHGDDDALATHLDWSLSHPRELAEMSREAYELAQRWGWPQYRAAIRDLVNKLLATPQSGGRK